MEVGADVWYKCKNDGWTPSTIINKSDTTGQVRFTVQKNKSKEEFVIVANKDSEVDSLKLMNSAEESEVENLINLPFLHEPAILYCLELRYFRSQIYTYTGPILIAVNPFKKVDLYSDQLLAKYYNSGLSKAQGMAEVGPPLSPHPYAIADAAYRLMMSAIQSSYGAPGTVVTDQSILISGESGAGKTESTKIVLKYLTTVASETLQFHASEGTVMDKVLKSNPILEALGNAKTIRNDNSSRFGKFIELNFDKRGHLIGGFIRTYLLEKIRLTSQQTNERCFHVFYQIGAGGSAADKERWEIRSMNDFCYANQGNSVIVEKLDDKAEYADMRGALDTLRFLPEDQTFMLDIIAGILHLGQIKFIPDKDGEGSELAKDAVNAKSLATALRLLGLPNKELVKTVTERTIVARNEVYQKKLTSTQASDARDSMSRVIYGKLFDWVVATINKEIKTLDPSAIRSEIGVLDIFGFECLKENSFEQLCINYTNETLQQQFNQFVFKMEQEEYTREGIEWSFVSFPDNQDCIDLIDLKKKSIFSTLDDECMLAGGSDAKFASRMITELGEYDRFSVSPAQKIAQQFSINHYAGEVVYYTATFVDKNKDELPKEASDLMGLSSMPLLQFIFSPSNAPPSSVDDSPKPAARKEGRSALGSPTICTQFKAQLASLISKIHSTKPHYIRCLKPNDQNKPDNLNRIRTTEQLRYGGVLEAVRVARSGFPVRLTHEDFYARYRPLANPFSPFTSKMPRFLPPASSNKADAIKACNQLLELMWDDSSPKLAGTEKNFMKINRTLMKAEFWRGKGSAVATSSIQLGKTKVFFRKQAHDFFEGRRSRNMVVHARTMQAGIRGWLSRIWFRQAKASVLRLQIAIRYFIFHRRFVKKRRLNAALRLQTAYRTHMHTKRFHTLLSALLSLQKSYRGKIARRVVAEMLRNKYATKVQANIRRLVARFRYRSLLRAIIATQNKFRCGAAKRALRDLRVAARDIGNLKQSNEALKLEIERLKAYAAQETARAKLQQHEVQESKLKDDMEVKESEIEQLRRELEEERRAREVAEGKLGSAEAAVVAEIQARTLLETQLEEQAAQLEQKDETNMALEAQVLLLQRQAKMPKSPARGNSSNSAKDFNLDVSSPASPVHASAVPAESNSGISEEKLAEILSDYISLNEHDRIVKNLNEESAVLRRTISKSSEAQHELLKQFQKRKSVSMEGEESSPLQPAVSRGILKSQSVKIKSVSSVEMPRAASEELSRQVSFSGKTAEQSPPVYDEVVLPPVSEDESLKSVPVEVSFVNDMAAINEEVIESPAVHSSAAADIASESIERADTVTAHEATEESSEVKSIPTTHVSRLPEPKEEPKPLPYGSLLNKPVESEPAALIKRTFTVPGSGPPAMVKSKSVKTPLSPTNAKKEAEQIKKDSEHVELLRKVANRPSMTPTSGRPKSMNATELMKSLKTPEGIALLKTEYGDNLGASPMTPLTPVMEPVTGEDTVSLGYRPSPHPDHFVPKKHVMAEEATVAPPTPQQRETEIQMQRSVFDSNLENFKNRFVQGFNVVAYTPSNPSTDCVLQLEKPALLHFTPPPRRFSLFARRSTYIPPVSVFDINEITNGMSKEAIRTFTDITESARNEGFFITMTFSVRSVGVDEYSSKFVLLKFPSSAERNALLIGLRSLLSEIQLKMSSTPLPSSNNTPNQKSAAFTPPSVRSVVEEDASELRASYEMLIVQLFILSNDLNEREDELIEMRKREEILQQLIASKERMYETDAIVRMQLGKRLEQVLMDKEEMKDQLEQCKAQLEQISLLTSKTSATPMTTPIKPPADA